MKIEVTSLRLLDPQPSGLCGFADIKMDGIHVKDFRIVHRNGKPFIEGPFTTRKKDGQMFFNLIVIFPEDLKVQIDTAILTAFFREKELTHEKTSQV